MNQEEFKEVCHTMDRLLLMDLLGASPFIISFFNWLGDKQVVNKVQC